MTDRDTRRRLVSLSVVAVSALALGGGYLVVAGVDRDRRTEAPPERIELVVTVPSPAVAVAAAPPIAGLVPAPRPVRRVVVVRRSRAS